MTSVGAARLRVLERRPPGMLLVHEIYASIQGESTRAGLPCTFVRLTGCPLRCRYCDTPHAFAEGTAMTQAEVLAAVDLLVPTLVEVTGGEPLAQPECLPLLAALADAGRTVLLETSGCEPIGGVDPRVTVILDLKCPSSGEVGANDFRNLALLKPGDETKFVIGDRADFDWMLGVVREHRLDRGTVLVAPAFGAMPYATLCEWILGTGLPLRFQPQLHKHVWPPATRGV